MNLDGFSKSTLDVLKHIASLTEALNVALLDAAMVDQLELDVNVDFDSFDDETGTHIEPVYGQVRITYSITVA